MDDNEARLGATVVLWAAVAAIFIAGSPTSFTQEMLVAFSALATLGMWITPYLGSNNREKAKHQFKSKADIDENEIRLRVLMDMLDEEDKARIRSKLMNGFSDGELPVDEFLEDRSAQSLQSES